MVGLLTFFLFLYAMVGMQLFANAFHYQCYHDVTGEAENDIMGTDGEPSQLGCGGVRECPEGFSCLFTEDTSPFMGTAGFDNIGLGMLTMFQVRSAQPGCQLSGRHSPLLRQPGLGAKLARGGGSCLATLSGAAGLYCAWDLYTQGMLYHTSPSQALSASVASQTLTT